MSHHSFRFDRLKVAKLWGNFSGYQGRGFELNCGLDLGESRCAACHIEWGQLEKSIKLRYFRYEHMMKKGSNYYGRNISGAQE